MLKNDPLTGAEIVQLPQSRRLAPVPQRLQTAPCVPFASWVEARDRAASALLGGARRLSLTGPAGTGKTVLIDHTARVLRAAGRSVAVQLADADPTPPTAGSTLFVDEADRLAPEKLRRLLEAEGAVVLAGLPTPGLRRLPGATHIALEPLGSEQTRDYLVQWLAATGRTPSDLDEKAVRQLAELSGGVPRLLSTLLSAAAWLAQVNGAAVIGATHVEEAAELRSVLAPLPIESVIRPPRRTGRIVWSSLLAGAVIAAAALVAAPRLFPHETRLLVQRGQAVAGQVGDWFSDETGRAPRGVQQPTGTQQSAFLAPATALPAAQPPILPSPTAILPTALPPPQAAVVPEQPAAEMQAAEPAPASAPEVAQVPAPLPVAPMAAAPILSASTVAAPTLSAPPAPAPAAAVATVRAAPAEKLPAETIDVLLRRGREMFRLDDVSAARLLFRRAAEGGSTEAMLELGRTYDPTVLAGTGASRMADQQEATRWYSRATAGN